MGEKCINWADIGTRAGKTFIQAFIATLTVDGVLTINNFDTVKAAIYSGAIAACAAVLSALMNTASCIVKYKKFKKEKNNNDSESNQKEQ